MSSIVPKSSNPLEMTESDHVTVDITVLGKEWLECMEGKDTTKNYIRQRRIGKIPSLLLESKKGCMNRECYEPAVVSLGPYHYKRRASQLVQAERCKLKALEAYSLATKESVDELYKKVFDVVGDAKKCYIDGSTDAYTNEEFSRMMLLDACFILLYIESITSSFEDMTLALFLEHLGAIATGKLDGDILLLENQIPFVVFEVLLMLRFPEDLGEDMFNRFFTHLNHGDMYCRSDQKVLENNKHPLHLLDLYRSNFISLSGVPTKEVRPPLKRKYSATELKSKWISLKRVSDGSRTGDMHFESHSCYGVLNLVSRHVSGLTKGIYMNMIAYEMCPHNPNDFRVTTYLQVMKSLVIEDKDVRELREKEILVHSLGRDSEVVKMLNEIEVNWANYLMFTTLWQGILTHQNSKYKTWVGELITDYFSSPWKALGLLVATAILLATFLQTYFTTKPVHP